MSNFDFNAHAHLSGTHDLDVQNAIDSAIKKSDRGIYVVCVTNNGETLVLPEFSALVREDISEVVFDTQSGYNFERKGACK